MRQARHGFVKSRGQVLLMCAALLVLLMGAERFFLSGNGPAPARPAASAQPAKEAASQECILPLDGEIICLDAGHGGYDGGARAKDSGVWEKEINFSVVQKTALALESLGAKIVLTRSADYALCDEEPKSGTKKRQDMERRIQLAKEEGATMIISIHMNEYRNRSQSGPVVFYRKGQDTGRLMAGIMQQALIDTLGPRKKRAAQAGDYYILSLDVPSVLVECGFISNAAEEKLLLSADYQDKIANAIAKGVLEYRELFARVSSTQP